MYNLQQKIDDLGWRQSDLAEKVGITKATISRWCTGKNEIPKILEAYIEQSLLIKQIYNVTVRADKKGKNSKFRK
jgi:transcriptional regulator with XRE-family HTH domain